MKMVQNLLQKQGTDLDEAIKTWKELSRKEARSLSESLKESHYFGSVNTQKARQIN